MSREWLLTAYAVLSLVSTIATYSKPFVPGHVRLLVALSAVFALVAAAIRVDLKRQREIAELAGRLSQLLGERKRRAELVIHPGSRSKYVALRANDQHPLPLKGLHIEIDLAVENKGERVSSVNHYALTLPDFNKSYSEIKPYATQMVRGRSCNFAADLRQFFSPEEFIRIAGESVAGPKLIAFELLDLPLGAFGKKAFDGNRETLILPPIRCELKVTDTEGYSASHQFSLEEAK